MAFYNITTYKSFKVWDKRQFNTTQKNLLDCINELFQLRRQCNCKRTKENLTELMCYKADLVKFARS